MFARFNVLQAELRNVGHITSDIRRRSCRYHSGQKHRQKEIKETH